MKLYYSPGACSLSPHIALHEAGLAFTPVLASTKSHKLQDGTDYYTINPLGYVPMLELDDGKGRPPVKGDTVDYGRLRLEVTATSGRGVREVRASLLPESLD